MKLSFSFPILVAVLDAEGVSSVRTKRATRKIARNARRVEDQGQQYYNGNYGNGNGDEEDNWFLRNYSLKMISCLKGEQSVNYETGETESDTVFFRLCPADTCSNSTSTGCDEGYGDFAVGLNTFAESYIESIRDNYNNSMQFYYSQYGEFNVDEYVNECRVFQGDEENENNNGYSYSYIGATCTDDGTDIRLASFSDAYCSEESDTAFNETHYGMELPYASGGLIPDDCMSCVSMNDNYEYELNEMCQQTYEDASYKCEQNMNTSNYYNNTSGCDYIEEKLSSSSSSKTENKRGNNFFRDQSESTQMAEAYLIVLIMSGLVGFAIVFFFVKTAVKRRSVGKDGAEHGEPPSFGEYVGDVVGSTAQTMKEKIDEASAPMKEKFNEVSMPMMKETFDKVSLTMKEKFDEASAMVVAKFPSVRKQESFDNEYSTMEDEQSNEYDKPQVAMC